MESLGIAIAVFVGSAVFVVLAGIGLARFGDELAEKTGWGTLWVGTVLVSVATSLPEVTVNIAAVWLEDSPGLALGNVYGANMINILVIGIVALGFGAKNLFTDQGRDTQILILVGLGLVALATLLGASGDWKLGPTSVGALLIVAAYVVGMRAVYRAGRTEMHAEDVPSPRGSARNAWIGFGLSALVVIVAARFLAASADAIAEHTGIGASFIGVVAVALVTTLPEGSVTIAASLRRSYGLVLGNVYGSCAFNILIISIADLFRRERPLLAEMQVAHFVAAGAAFLLMGTGYVMRKSFQVPGREWGRKLTPVIPVIYFLAVYLVFVLA
jgi:cation:H+ antiporter